MARRIYSRSTNTTSFTSTRIVESMQAEADRLLNDFRNQLAKELMKQLEAASQQLSSDSGSTGASDSSSNDGSGGQNYGAFLSLAVKYIFRGGTSRNSAPTNRSIAAQQEFRLSQSQAAAQANAALAKAQKNS